MSGRQQPGSGDVRAAVTRVMPSVRADLERLVRIPSVSAADFDQRHVQASADLTAALLSGVGLDVQQLTVPGGRPAVLGRLPAPPGAPTVLLYAHHDVQPPGERADWTSDPFEPTERDGRLFGRGAADDKAGIAAHLAALRAFADLDMPLPVGVTVLVEGEEEIGSPTLPAFLAAHGDLLAADVMVLADSVNWAIGLPALTTSLRGLVATVVEVKTLDHGIHSGMYGGPVPDALTALVRMLASLHTPAGDVGVQGLVIGGTGTADPLDLTAEQLRADAGVLPGVELIGSGALTERLWTRPSITVLGIDVPSVAQASNTLAAVARAKVSLRLAPGDRAQRALDALEDHLRQAAPWGAEVSFSDRELGEPYRIEASGPAYDIARSAFETAWGVAPVDIGAGGSIPLVAAFADAFPRAAILVTGVEDPDTRAHGADESLHLGEFAKVCLAEALLLQGLGGAT